MKSVLAYCFYHQCTVFCKVCLICLNCDKLNNVSVLLLDALRLDAVRLYGGVEEPAAPAAVPLLCAGPLARIAQLLHVRRAGAQLLVQHPGRGGGGAVQAVDPCW
jgi:hypothetical protein